MERKMIYFNSKKKYYMLVTDIRDGVIYGYTSSYREPSLIDKLFKKHVSKNRMYFDIVTLNNGENITCDICFNRKYKKDKCRIKMNDFTPLGMITPDEYNTFIFIINSIHEKRIYPIKFNKKGC